MSANTSQIEFWQGLEKLVADHTVVIDRPKDQAHPHFPDMIYPLDYGYLDGTQTLDGSGIDVWLGSGSRHRLDGVVMTVDLKKQDAEIKILLGCGAADVEKILSFLCKNELPAMAILRKGNN